MSAIGVISHGALTSRAERLNTAAGHGSRDTRLRRASEDESAEELIDIASTSLAHCVIVVIAIKY